jgi:aquaporin Z
MEVNMREYLAEFFGTFTLVFIGCASAVIAGNYIGFLGVAFAFGLTLLVMVYAFGNISGCHINPAVTIGLLICGRIKPRKAVGYVIAQCFGAVLAAVILLLVAQGNSGYSLAVNGLGQNGYGAGSPAGYALGACFIAEVVLTGMFVFAVIASTSGMVPKRLVGIPIGLALAFVHLVGIPITGMSVNPARSLGPAVVAGGLALSQLWLFWVAPPIGAVIAALVWRFVFEKTETLERKKEVVVRPRVTPGTAPSQ